ncbi:unnamed protein product [Rhizophagus irregularis]|nr:unnamed protein product [Rhizophagus irregularis]
MELPDESDFGNLPDEFLRTGLEGPCSNILNRNSGRNYEPDFVCVKGTPEQIHEPDFGWKVIRERRKRKRKEKGNISKVQRSLDVWNSTFRKVQRSLDVWNSTFRKVQTVLERMEFNISKVFTGFYFGTRHLIHE